MITIRPIVAWHFYISRSLSTYKSLFFNILVMFQGLYVSSLDQFVLLDLNLRSLVPPVCRSSLL